MHTPKTAGAIGLVFALMAACADPSHAMNPMAPSAASPWAASTLLSAQASQAVELEGLITAKSGNVLTVDEQDVLVPPGVVPHHGSHVVAFADLAVGDRVHVRASLVDGVLTASEVKLQNPGDGDGTGGVQEVVVLGLVSNLGQTSCPNLTFNLGTQAVATSSATVFDSFPCGVIVDGMYVRVTGVLSGSTLNASIVHVFP